MSLLRLETADFRNLVSVKISPLAEGFAIFHGPNGSGKTSLLEAIYYLSRGRSFRSVNNNRVIANQADKFSLFAQLQTKPGGSLPVGIERGRGGELRIRIAGQESTSFSELTSLLPVLLMNATSFSLLDAGPVFRRKYLDWGAFYVFGDFLRAWKQYDRALKQRNAALRSRASKKEIDVWSFELSKSAIDLDALRQTFFQQFFPFLQSALDSLISIPGLKMSYYPGWNSELSFADSLAKTRDKDIDAGYTQIGPHRADFKITIGGAVVKDILSRGQQKLFVCAMIVAQGAMLKQCINRKPIYLMDDLPAELDRQSRSNLLSLLSAQQAQVFVTAVEHEVIIDSCVDAPFKLFHVEHGHVRETN